MDPRLQHAAETGSINDFYALIEENPYILDNINAVPFVNTPLHVAAASDNIPFAMEMLNLKPSFARKLNTSGYSPLHLAVEKDHREFITWLLWRDPGLVRVKGREGITPFHLLAIRGDVNLVAECLKYCPVCIQDVSVNGHNALHLAVMNDRFEILQVLTGWLQRMSQKDSASTESDFLNRKDLAHNTPLHLAAYKEDHQAVKLLLQCQLVKLNEVNADGLTFLDILRNNGQSRDLDKDLEQVVVKTGCKEAASLPQLEKPSDQFKSPVTFLAHCSIGIRRLRSDTSEEGRAVFLIICTLILTSTYQTALQPPGGVHQSEGGGTAVMKQTFFIVLWVSNTIGFCCALLYTFCLLPIGSLFTTWFFWIGASLGVSYALAMAIISPNPLLFLCAAFTLYLLFPMYLFMEIFIALRLSHLKAAVNRMFVTFVKQRGTLRI
ncbi:putative ankyrin repeat-containing domain, PGG domain, ankyrin repeat-containing domain superfamily [Arabidopsis thaliana]|uniref:Ankyrin repeat family protein n=3 Tax=Arabidopsis TaxID=3701 RepID=Q9M9R3_ARATH|nr:Ankyrin repeat family protein [Arabidopsis thaliana]KAG7646303.1 Ankyrin repeat-containing domain [Arabidopsis thaliana x Arabidopsis arenosa]AAF43951.1 Contains similarity to a hypothetical protein from Arabidopsis thaliana gb/AF080119.1 and contains Ankyrin PF/00023 repeats [Arabidopsis thaliana]AEE29172.1 Ankyrin repeat family protein [Arabidopsis thaliana]OAP14653.1 hypothetical protein AXX17_AT1G15100 [Arabidopsis thaliana]CAA0203770.1 unnamed protein product [Arabidopsis thaliana]|eukprot:NP_172902.1 Ankyrin repeat family protein [Arabidopsis thaliana]